MSGGAWNRDGQFAARVIIAEQNVRHRLPATASQAEVLAAVAKLNADPSVDAILVQLPLPRHLDAEAVIAAVSPDKDVDGMHPLNLGLLASGRPREPR